MVVRGKSGGPLFCGVCGLGPRSNLCFSLSLRDMRDEVLEHGEWLLQQRMGVLGLRWAGE